MSALRGITAKVSLVSSYVDGEKERYSLLWNPAAGLSVLLIRQGDKDEAIEGALGLVQVETQETLQQHACTLVFKAGGVADRLLDLVEPMDALRVEILGDDGVWEVAFDGFVVSENDRQVSTMRSASRGYTIQAVGFRKILEQSWLNWQGKIRAGASKELFGPGSSLYKKLTDEGVGKQPTWLIETLLRDGVGQFLGLYVGGEKLEFGTAFQVGEGADWDTAFDLKQAFSRDWYLQSNGPLWSILAGLSEPDVHEFFVSYRPRASGNGDFDIPTLIFRPRPWPGPEGDDAGWNALDVTSVGAPGSGTASRDVVWQKSDTQAPNVFSLAAASASDGTAADNNVKIRTPFMVDRKGIARRGFFERQVVMTLTPQGTAGWWGEVGTKILRRVAYQEAPLPYLWDFSGTYPLLAGARAGTAFEDQALGMAGYLVSVSHRISVREDGVSASTSLGAVRCLRGSDVATYPDIVRRLVNITEERWIESEPAKETEKAAKPTSEESQPAVRKGGDHQRLTKSEKHPNIPNTPTGQAAQNLERLKKKLQQVEGLVGPVRVTSGYRSDALNRAVKGRENSQHKDGNAVDFQPAGDAQAAWETLKNTPGLLYDQLILEIRSDGTKWIHMSQANEGDTPRRQAFIDHV